MVIEQLFHSMAFRVWGLGLGVYKAFGLGQDSGLGLSRRLLGIGALRLGS